MQKYKDVGWVSFSKCPMSEIKDYLESAKNRFLKHNNADFRLADSKFI